MADDPKNVTGATGAASSTGPGATEPSGATGASKPKPEATDGLRSAELRPEDRKTDEPHVLDGALESVRGEKSVAGSVRVMADRLANLFTNAAIDGPDAAETLANDLRSRENDFADAVAENTPDAKASAPAEAPSEEELLARNHAAPHNEAAAAAVEAGMDTKTANEMTRVGSNI